MNETKIYITDIKQTVDLNLVPGWTNNTWTTDDEIKEWNNGAQESAGFHWNEGLDRWETDSANFGWWKELAEGRAKAYSLFEDFGAEVNSDSRNGWYDEFHSWLRANSNELEDEKNMADKIPDFIEAIRNGEVQYLDEGVADEISAKYESRK